MRPAALALARGQARVLEIRDEHGKTHQPPFSCEVLLLINWGQKAFRIEPDGTVTSRKKMGYILTQDSRRGLTL